MNIPADTIIYIVVLIFSVVIHEVAHGWAAYKMGDPTAHQLGRLTLNPLKHIDLFGSIILPVLLILAQSPFLFAWAKPVPFNPANFETKWKRWGAAIVAFAGPLTNLMIATIVGLLLRWGIAAEFLSESMFHVGSSIVLLNIVLAVFNLVPIPPLDGHHILFSLLPKGSHKIKEGMIKAMPILLVVLIVWGAKYLEPIFFFLYRLIVGVGL